MNKKVALLSSVLLLAPVTTQAKNQEITVSITPQQVYLNQEDITRYARGYNINQTNYYKLRDIQSILSQTEKKFKMQYVNKGAYGDILITRNQADDGVVLKEQYPTLENLRVSHGQDKIFVDKVYTEVKSFKINGENYYKLRDICNLLGVTVNYNSQSNSVELHTIGVATPKIEQPKPIVELENGKEVLVNNKEEMGNILTKVVEKGLKEVTISFISPQYKEQEIHDYINTLEIMNDTYVNQFQYNYNMLSDGTITKITFTFKSRVGDGDRQKAEAVIDSWVKQNISQSDNDYTKVKKIHDFIIDKVDYKQDSETTTSGHSVYDITGAMLDGQAVCDGYSKAFQEIAKKAGLETKRVTGDAWNDSYSGPHAWNLVKVNGKWYHVDTTWDDPITSDGSKVKVYDFFLKSDDYMAKSRTWPRDRTPKALENYK